MHILYGTLMALMGLFILLSALRQSDFIVYRLLVARSRLLWGHQVHRFLQIVGAILVVLGLLWACGIIWMVT